MQKREHRVERRGPKREDVAQGTQRWHLWLEVGVDTHQGDQDESHGGCEGTKWLKGGVHLPAFWDSCCGKTQDVTPDLGAGVGGTAHQTRYTSLNKQKSAVRDKTASQFPARIGSCRKWGSCPQTHPSSSLLQQTGPPPTSPGSWGKGSPTPSPHRQRRQQSRQAQRQGRGPLDLGLLGAGQIKEGRS